MAPSPLVLHPATARCRRSAALHRRSPRRRLPCRCPSTLERLLRAVPAARTCAAVALVVMTGTAPTAAAADACHAAAGLTPVCGFERPEDVEVPSDGTWLLISEYGGLDGARSGRLTAYEPALDSRRTLYPVADADGEPDWGAADCPGAPGPAFSPHGIHHGPAGDPARVYAVNHGGREAVEIFELTEAGTPGAATLRWRGCVVAPEGVWMNDVAGLPGGGFAVTHMIEKGTGEAALHAAERERTATGYVLEWSPYGGWQRLPATDGSLPNGIEVADDGATLYVNEYFGDRVYAYDRGARERRWETAVDAPDNLGWAGDGQLLVASHHEPLAAIEACGEQPDRFCTLRFAIVAVDPGNGNRLTIVEGGGRGAAFGAATVAVEVDETLYLGSFVGDRMAFTRRGTGVRR